MSTPQLPEKWRNADGVPRPDHRDRCYAECTGKVIFVLRRKIYDIVALPDGYEYDSDLETIVSEDDPEKQLTNKELSEIASPTGYGECALSRWEIDSVWLSREEAEAYAKRKEYNFPDGWQVYGLCAGGELAELLKGT